MAEAEAEAHLISLVALEEEEDPEDPTMTPIQMVEVEMTQVVKWIPDGIMNAESQLS